MTEYIPLALALDDVRTWGQLLEWAWQGIQDASPWLAPLLWTVIAIAALVLWVRGRGWQKLKAALKWAQRAVRAVDQFLTLADDIRYVKEQLENNGGSTVKDTVQRLDKSLVRVERKVDGAARTAREAKKTAAESQHLLLQHLSNQST